MKPVGTHIVAEFHQCRKEVLNDRQALESILTRGIQECGLTFVNITSHCYDPVGITVIAVISESHVAVHTYPEARHASIDVFTCSPHKAITANLLEYLKEAMGPVTTRVAEISRGNPLEIAQTDWILNIADAMGYDVRYHVREVIYSKLSPYQQIDIIDNENFGRMLFLNQDLQIAEGDAHLYNESLVAPWRMAHPAWDTWPSWEGGRRHPQGTAEIRAGKGNPGGHRRGSCPGLENPPSHDLRDGLR